MDELAAHHFGPDPGYVGGMASAIRVIAEHRIGADSVTTYSTWRPKSPLASLWLTLVAAMRILRLRRSDVVHVHLAQKGSFIREGGLVVLSRLRGLTTVVTIHGSEFLLFASRHRTIATSVLRRAHLITCLDPDVLDFVSRHAPDVNADLLPNPVALDVTSPSADSTDELVVFAGEIGIRKGADVLVTAWRAVAEARPEARCVMVGPVNDYDVPPTERLEVRPPLDSTAIKCLIRTARVIVLPSRAEGMPMILTEAMSSGRPFVSTPVGGIPELAEEGGVLVPVDDHVSLAARLTELLSQPQLARELGERGREFCSTTRSAEAIDRRLRELYRLARRSG